MFTVKYKNVYLHGYICKDEVNFYFSGVQYRCKSLQSAKIKVSKLVK